ncbi:MAG: S1C family serine protease [Candidatus Bipolaricaulota bacterium]|nr:S1C family serine protease [Candidatus Bipolaricaulota bacterium]
MGGACLGLAQATDWPSLIQAAKPAVVWIQVETRQGTAFGSGAFVSPDGYILTAAHVIEDAIRITVIVEEQREYRASLVSVDHKADVAVLKIPCLESCRGWGASSRAHANPSPPIPRLRWSFEKGSPLAVAGRET